MSARDGFNRLALNFLQAWNYLTQRWRHWLACYQDRHSLKFCPWYGPNLSFTTAPGHRLVPFVANLLFARSIPDPNLRPSTIIYDKLITCFASAKAKNFRQLAAALVKNHRNEAPTPWGETTRTSRPSAHKFESRITKWGHWTRKSENWEESSWSWRSHSHAFAFEYHFL